MKDVGKNANKANDDDDDYVEEGDDRRAEASNIDSIRNKLSKKSDPKKSKRDFKDYDDDDSAFDKPSADDEKRAEILREIKALKKDLKSEKVEKEEPKAGKKRSKSETEEEESNDLMKSLKEEKVTLKINLNFEKSCPSRFFRLEMCGLRKIKEH